MNIKNMEGLGFDLNIGSILKNLINQIIADYQAKLGNFLVAKKKILELKSRCNTLVRYPSVTAQASVELLTLNGLLTTQASIENSGFSILAVVNAIKSDPTVSDAIAGKLPQIYELEKWATLQTLLNNINNAKNQLLSFMAQVDTHLNNVNAAESRISGMENTAGIKYSAGLFANIPIVTILIIAGLGLGVVTKGFGLIKAVKGSRK